MNLEQVRAFDIPSRDHEFDWRDSALYALSLGFGADPIDSGDLRYVYEKEMVAVPSMCNTLAHPPFWLNSPVLEIDWVKVLHAEQSFTIHTPLPSSGKVRASYRIVSVEDKGPEKGALLTYQKMLHDLDSSAHFCTVTTSVFLRGDGGHGGFGDLQPQLEKLPERAPDCSSDIVTLPQTALLYRLNGDLNPLHADPQVAERAGFRQPILHGLATMGIAVRALLRARCGNDAARLRGMFVRFSSPVYPGETIRTEIFDEPGGARFRCRVIERDVIVLDRGSAIIGD